MENKKTFGEYICRRRKELGLTQREFADKLYVTESAVSKWERGLSYPDVTLLRDICAVLDITEHELLTASEDTEKRTAEKLAAKYLRLARNYRVTQYILYGGTILICFIVNLAVQHTLSWFWIVLASVLLAASLTLAPALVSMRPALERYKWAVSLGCAAASLELLLLICCLYTGGNWFWVAFAGTIFGLSLALLPFLLPTLPLPAALAGRKTSLYLGLETVLLILLLLVCCLYTGGDWLILAAAGTLFGLSVVFLPVFIRQLPLPQALGRHKALAYFSLETVFLMALLAVVCWRTGGDWFLTQGVPQALAALTLPWGLMALIRYLPVSRVVPGLRLLRLDGAVAVALPLGGGADPDGQRLDYQPPLPPADPLRLLLLGALCDAGGRRRRRVRQQHRLERHGHHSAEPGGPGGDFGGGGRGPEGPAPEISKRGRGTASPPLICSFARLSPRPPRRSPAGRSRRCAGGRRC